MVGADHARSMPAACRPTQAARPHLVWKFTRIGKPGSKWLRPPFVGKVPVGPADLPGPTRDPHRAGALVTGSIRGDQSHFLERRNHRAASARNNNVTFHRELI